jgi:hypothetical protein
MMAVATITELDKSSTIMGREVDKVEWFDRITTIDIDLILTLFWTSAYGFWLVDLFTCTKMFVGRAEKKSLIHLTLISCSHK